MSTDILTVTGRWRHNEQLSGIDKVLQPRELCLARAMYYAGFAACLEAQIELANMDLPDEEAEKVLSAWQRELKQVEGMLQMILSGVKPS